MVCAWKPKISCASSDDFSVLAKRFSQRHARSTARFQGLWQFWRPFFPHESFLFVKGRVEMDINGYSLARLHESGETG
jgi:hypothetical protein